ncbi:MAG: DUF1552 domain-containing protein, partial [Planctomycetota bacterium]
RLFSGQSKKEVRQAKSVREKYRKSILDFVKEDAQSLHRSLGRLDQQKLDEYLYSIRDIERRLGGSEKLMMTEEGVPDYPRPLGVPRKMDEHARLMMDMMTLAYQTDSTRIISFMFTNAGSNRPYKDLGVNDGHHELSHHGKSKEKQKKIATINRFHIQQFGYLLEKLSSVSEGRGSLLDNCMVLYGSGISDGDRHNHDDLPILLAGRAGGAVRPGNQVVFPKNTPLCNLYVWMLQQAGCDVIQFGDSNGSLKI